MIEVISLSRGNLPQIYFFDHIFLPSTKILKTPPLPSMSSTSYLSPFDDLVPESPEGVVVEFMPDADFYLARVAKLDAQIDEVNQ